ncbi:MAG: hypothetical protein KDD11_14255, partial [Acidobacteria bacterium]|nr:hypothetical protein [Acidobacteriota bacterium]
MQILLVSARRSAYTGESISAPHQGILSLASVLREGTFADTRGVHVEVLDDQLFVLDRPWAPPSVCLEGRSPDVVGVQCSTSSYKNALKILDEVRARNSRALRVLGGVGAGELMLLDGNALEAFGVYRRDPSIDPLAVDEDQTIVP